MLILADLVALEDQFGNSTAAEALRDEARELVDFIANHTGSPELRASFLAQPAVQSILGQSPATEPAARSY